MVSVSGLLQGYIMAGVEGIKFFKIKIVERKKKIIFFNEGSEGSNELSVKSHINK